MNDTLHLHSDKVRMVAHRGASGLEVENTCAAFVAAGNRSYWGIETDVRVTLDGGFVCLHNADTADVALDRLVVAESTYDALRSLRLLNKDGKKSRADLMLPSLDEYISICRKYGKQAVLELKGVYTPENLARLIGVIRSIGWLERTTFISGSLDNLLEVRRQLPDQPVQYVAWKLESEEIMETLIENRISLDFCFKGVTPELISRAHAAGLEVNVWTVDTLELANQLIGWGVDYLTSNIVE